jgi:uncharacterized protein YcbK (DUF882 family)
MKIIEALKNLKTIEKRIAKNCEDITKYAAWVDIETIPFETEEKQKAEVGSLIQANLDLEIEYLRLKTAIETTNLAVQVTVKDRTYSISNLVTLKRKAKDFRTKTYLALDGRGAVARMQQIYAKGFDAGNPPKVVAAYKEEDKNKAIRDWADFVDSIDGKLEVVNAETELQGY